MSPPGYDGRYLEPNNVGRTSRGKERVRVKGEGKTREGIPDGGFRERVVRVESRTKTPELISVTTESGS